MSVGTPAQEWARKRNFAKSQFKGMHANLVRMLNERILAGEEAFVNEIKEDITLLLERWDSYNETSKRNYLEGHNATNKQRR